MTCFLQSAFASAHGIPKLALLLVIFTACTLQMHDSVYDVYIRLCSFLDNKHSIVALHKRGVMSVVLLPC